MPTTVVSSSRKRAVAVIALLLTFAVLAGGCMNAEEKSFFDRTNALRASQGIPALAEHQVLDDKAQAWARTMASQNHLYHSNLRDGMSSVNWMIIGENVGHATGGGDWPLRLHNALVASPGHYANLVNRRFTHMGVGMARAGNGDVYIAEVFAEIR